MPFSMFNSLVQISHDAFKQRYFDTAYHSLAAAMHLAAKQSYMLGLKEVESVSVDFATWVDMNPQEYRHSSETSADREKDRIFEKLSRLSRLEQLILMQQTKEQ